MKRDLVILYLGSYLVALDSIQTRFPSFRNAGRHWQSGEKQIFEKYPQQLRGGGRLKSQLTLRDNDGEEEGQDDGPNLANWRASFDRSMAMSQLDPDEILERVRREEEREGVNFFAHSSSQSVELAGGTQTMDSKIMPARHSRNSKHESANRQDSAMADTDDESSALPPPKTGPHGSLRKPDEENSQPVENIITEPEYYI